MAVNSIARSVFNDVIRYFNIHPVHDAYSHSGGAVDEHILYDDILAICEIKTMVAVGQEASELGCEQYCAPVMVTNSH